MDFVRALKVCLTKKREEDRYGENYICNIEDDKYMKSIGF
jgi:hypothetical protein